MKREQSEQDGQGGFARRAAWLTTANSIAFGLSFIAPLMLVRTLSQTEFGVYKQVFQILMSVTAALNLQVASTAYYFAPRAPEKKLHSLKKGFVPQRPAKTEEVRHSRIVHFRTK